MSIVPMTRLRGLIQLKILMIIFSFYYLSYRITIMTQPNEKNKTKTKRQNLFCLDKYKTIIFVDNVNIHNKRPTAVDIIVWNEITCFKKACSTVLDA